MQTREQTGFGGQPIPKSGAVWTIEGGYAVMVGDKTPAFRYALPPGWEAVDLTTGEGNPWYLDSWLVAPAADVARLKTALTEAWRTMDVVSKILEGKV